MKSKLLLAFTVLITLIVSIPSNASASQRCDSPGSTTVKRIGKVRVFFRVVSVKHGQDLPYTKEVVYACYSAFGKKIRLGATEYGERDSYRDYQAAGRFLGYVEDALCGACSDYGSRVDVLDLRNGNSSRGLMGWYVSTATFPECVFPTFCRRNDHRIFLRKSGSFAISYDFTRRNHEDNSIGEQTNIIEKHELGPGLKTDAATILDRPAATTDLDTLKLTGNVLSWTNAGKAKTASIK